MLTKQSSTQRDQLDMVALNQLMPEDHLVCKIELAIDFSFIYDLVQDHYSEIGRPCLDPFFKLPLIQYSFGILMQ